ncbi:MAG: hypothetical protein DWQ48_10445 [Bacteroidetes bacterium]|nr:MAG: hypothetical protein DWQ48_10445 [Bacteroidota bacterium]
MRIPGILVFLFFITIISSCKKDELFVVEGNLAPPDRTIESVTIETYINRSYILVLGREPLFQEMKSAFQTLSAANADSTSRYAFLTDLFNKPDYLVNLYNQNKINLLNNVDTSDFSTWIFLFQFYLNDSSFIFQWPVIQYELDRMKALRDAFPQFTNGSINIQELHSRMSNNYLYDQINMGSANFVISTFQNLLIRNPTLSEQSSGVSMVDGLNAILFLQAGKSKVDYLRILTESSNYYEAQVVHMYRKYLRRDPITMEMSAGTALFSSANDYTAVQKLILASDEFIGL